jgi:hypothetical protein
MEPKSPFGGITVVLMAGDFYQLPHVAEPYNLYSVTIKLLVDRKEIENGDPDQRTRGGHLFSQLIKFELSQQMRASEDATHTAMLNQMRTPYPGCSNINSASCINTSP